MNPSHPYMPRAEVNVQGVSGNRHFHATAPQVNHLPAYNRGHSYTPSAHVYTENRGSFNFPNIFSWSSSAPTTTHYPDVTVINAGHSRSSKSATSIFAAIFCVALVFIGLATQAPALILGGACAGIISTSIAVRNRQPHYERV